MASTRKALKTYVGDGVQKIFAFSFDYINKTYVKVLVNGTALTYGTQYTVVDKQVELETAPALDAYIVVARQTPTERLVVWQDGSVLRETELTLFELQLLHISEETSDAVQESGMALDETDGKWDARLRSIKNIGTNGLDLEAIPSETAGYRDAAQAAAVLAGQEADRAAAEADSVQAIATQIGTIPTPVPAHAGEGIVVNEVGDGFTFGSSGSGNVVLIGHSNTLLSTSTGEKTSLLQMWFLQDDLRNKRKLKVSLLDKGNGSAEVSLTDGTTTVTAVGAVTNNASWTVRELKMDCTTLDATKVWTLTVYGTSVTGTYSIRRFNLTADPASQMVGNSLILWHPMLQSNYADYVVVGTPKYFPINAAIDGACTAKVNAVVRLDSGTSGTIKVSLKAVKDNESVTVYEENSFSASGIVELIVPLPSLVAPFVQVEVSLKTNGMVTLEHFEAWLEI